MPANLDAFFKQRNRFDGASGLTDDSDPNLFDILSEMHSRIKTAESRIKVLEANSLALSNGLTTTNSNIQNFIDTRYALEIYNVGLGPFLVPNSTTVLIPLPAITNAWSTSLWTLTNGVVFLASGLAGHYIGRCALSFHDTEGGSSLYNFTLVKGSNLATSPLIDQQYSFPIQITSTTEPSGVLPGGMFQVINACELGLLCSHDRPIARHIVIDSLSLIIVKQRDL